MQKLPLISIDEILNIYKNLHAKNPSFGMDTYEEGFKSNDFVILENNGKGSKGVPVRCSHYICILTLKGGSIRHINQHDYHISAHSLQLLVPGVMHSFEDTERNSQSIVLLFNPKFLANEVDELLLWHEEHLQYVDLDAIEFTRVLNLYEQLNIEYKNKNIGYEEISKYVLIQLLYLLKRKKLSKPKEDIQNRIQQLSSQFLSMVEEHFKELKSVHLYADKLGITPKHLSETIKESLDKPALHFIHKRILKEIQYLLCYSDMSIKQIASYLNFENSSDLGRFFKRNEGLSPKAYKLHFHN